jgi:D-glycero-D-manno-heptose 1,7-bisphosphate phosphatase
MNLARDAIRKAVFLDRDGTIIEDKHYLADPAGVVLLPGAVEALRLLQEAGYLLIVISNQSGVGRGYFSEEAVAAVQQRVEELLGEEGVTLDAFKYCPHGPDEGCACRKPKPGMLLEVAAKFDVTLSESASIGDRTRDAEAGLAAGCATNIVLGSVESGSPLESAIDIHTAAKRIVGHN